MLASYYKQMFITLLYLVSGLRKKRESKIKLSKLWLSAPQKVVVVGSKE